jgi:hypothetical protein
MSASLLGTPYSFLEKLRSSMLRFQNALILFLALLTVSEPAEAFFLRRLFGRGGGGGCGGGSCQNVGFNPQFQQQVLDDVLLSGLDPNNFLIDQFGNVIQNNNLNDLGGNGLTGVFDPTANSNLRQQGIFGNQFDQQLADGAPDLQFRNGWFFENGRRLQVSREGRFLVEEPLLSGRNVFRLPDPRTEQAAFEQLRDLWRTNPNFVLSSPGYRRALSFYPRTFANRPEFQLNRSVASNPGSGTGGGTGGGTGVSDPSVPLHDSNNTSSTRPQAPGAPGQPKPTVFSKWRTEFVDASKTSRPTDEDVKSATKDKKQGTWNYKILTQDCVAKSSQDKKQRATLYLFTDKDGKSKVTFLLGDHKDDASKLTDAWKQSGELRNEEADKTVLYHTFQIDAQKERWPETQLQLKKLKTDAGEEFLLRYVHKHKDSMAANRFGNPAEKDVPFYCKTVKEPAVDSTRPEPKPEPTKPEPVKPQPAPETKPEPTSPTPEASTRAKNCEDWYTGYGYIELDSPHTCSTTIFENGEEINFTAKGNPLPHARDQLRMAVCKATEKSRDWIDKMDMYCDPVPKSE